MTIVKKYPVYQYTYKPVYQMGSTVPVILGWLYISATITDRVTDQHMDKPDLLKF